MTMEDPSPATAIKAFRGIKEAASYFEEHGLKAVLRLTGDYKNTARIKNYFHRQGFNVTVKDEPGGTRLVTYNSASEKGVQTRRAEKSKYGISHRRPHEITLDEYLNERSNDIKVGEQFFIKGHGNNVTDLLHRRFSEWTFSKKKSGAGWLVMRES